MGNNSLPKDLRAYIGRKYFLRIAGYILWVVVWIFNYLYYMQDKQRVQILPTILLGVFVLVGGIFLFRINACIAESTYSGTLESTTIHRNFGRGRSMDGKFSLDEYTYLKMTVRTSSGKRKRIRVQIFDNGFSGYYTDGCGIISIKGLNYPLSQKPAVSGTRICAVCGFTALPNDSGLIRPDGTVVNSCPSCGHTLISCEKSD